jgi:hypothetical protein
MGKQPGRWDKEVRAGLLLPKSREKKAWVAYKRLSVKGVDEGVAVSTVC